MRDLPEILTDIKAKVGPLAPASISNLNPPATRLQLLKLKGMAPLTPKILLKLLALHNGEGRYSWESLFPDGMQLMEIDHILANFKYQSTSRDDFIVDLDHLVKSGVMNQPEGPVKPVFCYSKRIPFAHVNGELLWYLDMDPPEGGTMGQIVYEDAESLELRVVAKSMNELFEMYISHLEAGYFKTDEETGQISSKAGVWYRALGR